MMISLLLRVVTAFAAVAFVSDVFFSAFHLLCTHLKSDSARHNVHAIWEWFLRTTDSEVPPVKVVVCAEALCPDCKAFVVTELVHTFNTLGEEVMDLTLIPFGNAVIDKTNRTVECQHGIGECDANSYEQCLIAAYPKPNQYLPMLSCLYQTLPMGRHDDKWDAGVFRQCATSSKLNFDVIQTCHDDPDVAWKHMANAADATPTYHDHVPWIEIDGDYMNEETHDFFREVCNAYAKHGGSHPACSVPSNQQTARQKTRQRSH